MRFESKIPQVNGLKVHSIREYLVAFFTITVFSIAFPACQQRETPETLEDRSEGEQAATAAVAPDQREAQLVDVKLDEFSIDMPETLSPGTYTFQVENVGRQLHNFRISGTGVNETFDANLKPAEQNQITVTLDRGFYDVTCPVAQHAERGMKLNLSVQ